MSLVKFPSRSFFPLEELQQRGEGYGANLADARKPTQPVNFTELVWDSLCVLSHFLLRTPPGFITRMAGEQRSAAHGRAGAGEEPAPPAPRARPSRRVTPHAGPLRATRARDGVEV